ncbi:MAG: bacteriohemerythrin [Alphaproteobacteria bacterium]
MANSWNDGLRVGVAQVDADHQLLFQLMADLGSAHSEKEEAVVVGSVLNTLVSYTHYHFDREERIMGLCGFPLLEPHRELHRQLRDRVVAVSRDYQVSPGDVDMQGLASFLADWLVTHIQGEDVKIKPYVLANLDKLGTEDDSIVGDMDEIERDAMNEDWQWPV